MWATTKPTNVLADNKSVKRFFQTKAIPSSLWNAFDYVLQFTIKLEHISGLADTAADFLSRLELKVTEKISLKIWEDMQTTLLAVTTSSSDLVDEKQDRVGRADPYSEKSVTASLLPRMGSK